jgi:hypothetical protein
MQFIQFEAHPVVLARALTLSDLRGWAQNPAAHVEMAEAG